MSQAVPSPTPIEIQGPPPPREGKLYLFCDLPLGTRFRYPGGDTIWTIIDQWRAEPEDPLHGTLAEWRPDMLDLGRWHGQKIVSHIPGECPAHVLPID